MSNNNNNNNSNGIFINQSNNSSERQPDLQQPSIKRQRIDANNEQQHVQKNNSQQQIQQTSTKPSLAAFLDDSGNSTSSASSTSSPSPINIHHSEIILKSGDVGQDVGDLAGLLGSNDDQFMSDSECISTFQTQLTEHQCLCGLSEKILKIPFQYYSINKKVNSNNSNNGKNKSVKNENGENEITKTIDNMTQVHYIKSLKHWPEDYLLQFLSNLQLLFHMYLKQNAKGNICGKIMEICDCLIRNEISIFENLIELCNSSTTHTSNYINFVSSKIITYFLIIIKDEIDQEWLKKIVDNLFTFEHLDYPAVRRINFSLDIIKCIVEWKDHDEHVLEEDDINGYMPSTPAPPPLETNYFATYHDGPSTSSSSSALPSYLTSSTSSHTNTNHHNHHHQNSGRSSATSGHNSPISNGCHFVQLTDSESFDTTHIKCITIKILENKWPALVKNISTLITELAAAHFRQQMNNRSSSNNSMSISNSSMRLNNAENCILTFIALWESIISVKTNLSVIETLPFYAHLVNFESLLNQNLPCTIYKAMLQLFNEALCYGSTLALQDLLPEETCSLAHQIVRHVKDYRILESMPRHNNRNTAHNDECEDDNLRTLIGQNFETVIISPHSFDSRIPITSTSSTASNNSPVTFDKSLLQKMTLLVLKSVAVSVKEIRSDSSDSSIDSTDYEAFQEMMLIERSIRDVLKKLESFIKNTLEFHPESHFSKILIHLFDDQDDYLIEAMVCTLDVTSGISFRNNAFPELVAMLNPVYTFLEFLKMISNSTDLLLDLLVSNETCFLLYLLRFLKYIRINWSMFVQSCRDCGMGNNVLDDTITVMTRLRFKIGRLVSKSLYPYDIAPVLRLLESCENLYEGNELS